MKAMSDTNRKGRPLSMHKEFVEPLLSHITDPQEHQVAIAQARRQHEKNEEKRLHRLALNRESTRRRRLEVKQTPTEADHALQCLDMNTLPHHSHLGKHPSVEEPCAEEPTKRAQGASGFMGAEEGS